MVSAPEVGDVRRDDSWNAQHRPETPRQRADWNFAELLREIRVLLSGVQILLGFLLAMALSPHFRSPGRLPTRGVRGHPALRNGLVDAASGPIGAHRQLFQRVRRPAVVHAGHVMTRVALFGLGGTVCCGLMLVLDLAVGRVLAMAGTAILLIGIAVLWIWGTDVASPPLRTGPDALRPS